MEDFQVLLKWHYQLEPTAIRLLEGYADRTFLVQTADDRYILKHQHATEELRHRIALENELTGKLQDQTGYEFPVHVLTREGRAYAEEDGKILRLLTYLEGTFLAEAPQTDSILDSLGGLLAQMNLQSRLTPPGMLAGSVIRWDLQHMELHRETLGLVADPRDRALIGHYLLQYESEVLPHRHELRKALIHNDANDWNVLTRDGRVCGIIDFGDMCHSWLINELAVAMTYVLTGREDPLAAGARVIQAYNRTIPLLPLELDLLYYLIAARMCMSLCNSAVSSRERPDSDYIRISEVPIRKLLRKWIAISPEKARNTFRQAAGMAPVPTPDAESYLRRRKNILPPSLSLSYEVPIIMHRASFQYMFDSRGSTFLDAYNNIMLVGHCHPSVVDATSKVLRRLNTNTRYLYDELLDYGEHLLKYFPASLSRVFFVNSGSAATDLALRLCRAHTGRKKVLALEHGYHGNTLAGIDVSHYKHSPGASYPDTLLCPMPKVFGSGIADEASAAGHYSALCETLLHRHHGEVAAFIAEPIMGCGGQVPLPHGFLPRVYEMVRAQGGLCISDEVQVGFGRLGTWNWGYEKFDVVPDMVILGKPMGNGHPIGAVVTTAEIASCFDAGPEFFSSFGGNPVSCAAGLAVLRVLESEGLRSHAAETGSYLKASLLELARSFPCIADVRGDGLFLGVEMLGESGRPATRLAQALKNELRNAHILIGTDGPADNVLKIKPPLPFNRENCDQLTGQMSRILTNIGDS